MNVNTCKFVQYNLRYLDDLDVLKCYDMVAVQYMIVCRSLGCLLGTRMCPGFLWISRKCLPCDSKCWMGMDNVGTGMHVLFLVDEGTFSTEVKDGKVCEVLRSNKHFGSASWICLARTNK